jgi:hypothetical protein
MILEKSRDGGWQMETRQDTWAKEMRQSLCAASRFQCETLETVASSVVSGLIPSNSFEISPIHNVGVWHGGFCAAGDRINRIIEFLATSDTSR